MDNEQTVKAELFSRQSRELHHKFFKRDSTIEFIKVPVLNDHSLESPVIPFRNTGCMKPICVYDFHGLMKRTQSTGYKTTFSFVCRSCHVNIEFSNFYFDCFLNEIVQSVDKMQDIPNEIVYVAVIIKRNDTWQPVRWEKQKPLTETDSLVVQRRFYNEKRPPMSDSTKEEGNVAQSTPPHLDYYNQTEYEKLLQDFDLGSTANYVLYQNENNMLTRGDLSKLEQGEIITNSMTGMFADYLNTLQRAYKKRYCKSNGNRHFVIAAQVLSYDKISRRPKYEFLSCLNQYKDDPKDLLSKLDKLSFVLYYDERWIAVILDLKDKELLLVDFLAEGLSKIKSKEINDVIQYIIRAEFPHTNVKSFRLYNLVKLNFLSDCGLYVYSFIYKYMNNELMDNIDIQFWEKDLFRKKIAWLVLKIGTIQKLGDAPSALKFPDTTISSQDLSVSSASSLLFSGVSQINSSRLLIRSRESGLHRIPTAQSQYLSQVPRKLGSVNTIPEENERLESKRSSPKASSQKAQLREMLAEKLPVGMNTHMEPMDFKGSSRSLNNLDHDSLGALLKNPSEFTRRDLGNRRNIQRNISGANSPSNASLIMNRTENNQRRRQVTSLNNLDEQPKKIQFNNIFTGLESEMIHSITSGTKPLVLEESTRTLQISGSNKSEDQPLTLPPRNLGSPMDRDRKFFGSNSKKPAVIEDDGDNMSDVSQSIVLFGFQGKNQKAERINIAQEEQRAQKREQVYSLQNSMDTIVVDSKLQSCRESQFMPKSPDFRAPIFEPKAIEEVGIFDFDAESNPSHGMFNTTGGLNISHIKAPKRHPRKRLVEISEDKNIEEESPVINRSLLNLF